MPNAPGGTVTVQLPAFELASNTFKGAGAGGEVNVPSPGMMGAMTATVSVPVAYSELVDFFELGATKTLDLRADVTVSDPSTHELLRVPDRWVIKGPISKADPGKVEGASASDASFEVQVYYARHWLDGDEVLEWDAFNSVYKVNGRDLLADTRRNLMI